MGEKAKLQPIYQRLNGTAEYHPLNAETFSDWSMEAGDAVTISRNGEEYVSPVHTATLKWTGQPKISVESTGSNEREPLAKMSIRQYSGAGGGGGSGYRNSLGTREHIELVAQKADSNGAILRAAGLTLDAETGAVIYSEDFETNSIGSRIKVANDKIGMVVGTVTYDPSRLIEKSSIAAFPKTGTAGYFYKDLSTGKIYMWSYGKYREYIISADGKEATSIDAGAIAVAINESGDTTANIDATHVKIGNKNTQTVTLIGKEGISIGLFDTDNNGNIGLANGYGTVIDEDGYGQGIWQKGELSAGMFVARGEDEKTYTHIRGDHIKIGTESSSVNLADALEVVNYKSAQSVKIKKQTVLEGNNLWVVKSGGSGGKITASDLTIGVDGDRKIVFESSRGETAAEITRANAVEIGRTDQLRAKLVGDGNGSYKLLYLPIGQSSYVTSPTYTSFNGWLEGGNFSRATSLKESWSGSVVTISGKPTQNPALDYTIRVDGLSTGDPDLILDVIYYKGESETEKPTLIPGTTKRISVQYQVVEVTPGSGDDDDQTPRRTGTLGVDADVVYNEGWKAARKKVKWPSTSTTATEIKVEAPSATVDSSTPDSRTYYLDMVSQGFSTSTKVYLRRKDDDVSVAALPVGAVYTAGLNAGEGKFEQATVTPQGAAHASITPIKNVKKYAVETLYPIKTAKYYDGNGQRYSVQKAYSVYGEIRISSYGSETLYYKKGNYYYTAGTHDWYYSNSGGTYYYQVNGFDAIVPDNNGWIYTRGGEVTVNEADLANGHTAYYESSSGAKELGEKDTPVTGLYDAGTPDSTTYFKRKAST